VRDSDDASAMDNKRHEYSVQVRWAHCPNRITVVASAAGSHADNVNNSSAARERCQLSQQVVRLENYLQPQRSM
jgi:hypothetical protein